MLIEPSTDEDLAVIPDSIKNFAWFNKEQNRYQCLPMFLAEIIDGFSALPSTITVKWQVNLDYQLEKELDAKFTLRQYQQEALDSWIDNESCGVIVLPTGTGKTFVALAAIIDKSVRTLIVVPTINLLDQWRERLLENLESGDLSIGVFGGGKQEIEQITITTYDSGRLYSRRFRDQFGLLIFDEVHHLPTEENRKIAEQLTAPFRLGLTATLKRPDMKHKEVEEELVGPVVYKITPDEIQSSGYVAKFEIAKIFVDLTDEERLEYEKHRELYSSYLSQARIKLSSGLDFQEKLVKRMSWDQGAREAVRAHHKARLIALTAKEKIKALDKLLAKHKNESIIIFSEFTEVVELVSRIFLIPAITHKTSTKQRRPILKKFEAGIITKLATGRVLDEGFDVKRPSVAIIMSGSSVERQYIQRLGRILRPAEGKKAMLYEIIAKDTIEVRSSERRGKTITRVRRSK